MYSHTLQVPWIGNLPLGDKGTVLTSQVCNSDHSKHPQPTPKTGRFTGNYQDTTGSISLILLDYPGFSVLRDPSSKGPSPSFTSTGNSLQPRLSLRSILLPSVLSHVRFLYPWPQPVRVTEGRKFMVLFGTSQIPFCFDFLFPFYLVFTTLIFDSVVNRQI